MSKRPASAPESLQLMIDFLKTNKIPDGCYAPHLFLSATVRTIIAWVEKEKTPEILMFALEMLGATMASPDYMVEESLIRFRSRQIFCTQMAKTLEHVLVDFEHYQKTEPVKESVFTAALREKGIKLSWD
jgi:hypothetical protein